MVIYCVALFALSSYCSSSIPGTTVFKGDVTSFKYQLPLINIQSLLDFYVSLMGLSNSEWVWATIPQLSSPLIRPCRGLSKSLLFQHCYQCTELQPASVEVKSVAALTPPPPGRVRQLSKEVSSFITTVAIPNAHWRSHRSLKYLFIKKPMPKMQEAQGPITNSQGFQFPSVRLLHTASTGLMRLLWWCSQYITIWQLLIVFKSITINIQKLRTSSR